MQQTLRLERVAAILGAIAALCVFIMLVTALAFGVSQEPFELVKTAAAYTESLLAQGSVLRFVFTIDNIFILAYTGYFLAFFAIVRKRADTLLVGVGFAGFAITAMLDLIENFHILAMLRSAELGVPISDTAIQTQYVMSAVKFIVSYFAAMVFAWLFPRDTWLARVVAIGAGVGYPLLGVLCYTTPPGFAMILGLLRVMFFVGAFGLGAIVYWNRRET